MAELYDSSARRRERQDNTAFGLPTWRSDARTCGSYPWTFPLQAPASQLLVREKPSSCFKSPRYAASIPISDEHLLTRSFPRYYWSMMASFISTLESSTKLDHEPSMMEKGEVRDDEVITHCAGVDDSDASIQQSRQSQLHTSPYYPHQWSDMSYERKLYHWGRWRLLDPVADFAGLRGAHLSYLEHELIKLDKGLSSTHRLDATEDMERLGDLLHRYSKYPMMICSYAFGNLMGISSDGNPGHPIHRWTAYLSAYVGRERSFRSIPQDIPRNTIPPKPSTRNSVWIHEINKYKGD